MKHRIFTTLLCGLLLVGLFALPAAAALPELPETSSSDEELEKDPATEEESSRIEEGTGQTPEEIPLPQEENPPAPTSEPPTEAEPEETLPPEEDTPIDPEEEQLEEEAEEALEELEEELIDAAVLEDGSIQWDEQSIIVSNYTQLSNALSQDNGFTMVYLGASFSQTPGVGITIHPSKASVTIDGVAPNGDGSRATFTQARSEDATHTIRVPVSNRTTKLVTLQNMNIEGNNFYGVVAFAADTAVADVRLVIDNVNYGGSQIIYHRLGTALIRNSNIELYRTGSETNEVAEANRIEFEGEVNIDITGSPHSAFWLTSAGASMELMPGASVSLSTNNYFLYADASNPTLSIGQGASLYVNAPQGFIENGHALSSLTVAPDATFSMMQSSTTATRRMRITQSLVVCPGATFEYDRAGTEGSTIQFTQANARAEFTDPALVRISNGSGTVIDYLGTGSITVSADSINRWPTGSSTAAPAPQHWNKAETELADFTLSWNGSQRTLSTNISATTDPVAEPLSTDTFYLVNTLQLTFGRISLAPGAVTDESTTLTGATATNAALTARFETVGGAGDTSGAADSGGSYTLPLDGRQLVAGSTVTTTATARGLSISKWAVVLAAGDFTLALVDVPATLTFATGAIPEAPTLYARSGAPFTLTVRDSRFTPATWSIQASISGPLAGEFEGETHTLTDALVYVSPGGSETPLDEEPMTVYTALNAEQGETLVEWPENEGILLFVDPGEALADVNYSTTIEWLLIDAP